MDSRVEIAIAVLALAIIIFVPRVRRIVGNLLGLVVGIAAIAGAIGGSAVLMNDVSIYDSPGLSARVRRFLTIDWAATSEKGLGSAPCTHGWPGGGGAAPERGEARAPEGETRAGRGSARRGAAGEGRPPTPTPVAGEAEDYYPELVRHGYPGISRSKLFELSKETVNSLGGWNIAASDPRAYTIDCVYTTRILRFQDDVRIVATPNSEIDLCSRSKVGEPDSGSLLGLFPGDFGANIGHIKEFYQTLEPRVDAVYKEQERRQEGRKRRRPKKNSKKSVRKSRPPDESSCKTGLRRCPTLVRGPMPARVTLSW